MDKCLDFNTLCATLTDIKGTDGERGSDHLIHRHLPGHRPDPAPRQRALQRPQPEVVEVGMETEPHSGHTSGLTPVDAGSRVFPPQHALLYDVGRGEKRGVAEHVPDVRVSPEHSPDPPHGDLPESTKHNKPTWEDCFTIWKYLLARKALLLCIILNLIFISSNCFTFRSRRSRLFRSCKIGTIHCKK